MKTTNILTSMNIFILSMNSLAQEDGSYNHHKTRKVVEEFREETSHLNYSQSRIRNLHDSHQFNNLCKVVGSDDDKDLGLLKEIKDLYFTGYADVKDYFQTYIDKFGFRREIYGILEKTMIALRSTVPDKNLDDFVNLIKKAVSNDSIIILPACTGEIFYRKIVEQINRRLAQENITDLENNRNIIIVKSFLERKLDINKLVDIAIKRYNIDRDGVHIFSLNTEINPQSLQTEEAILHLILDNNNAWSEEANWSMKKIPTVQEVESSTALTSRNTTTTSNIDNVSQTAVQPLAITASETIAESRVLITPIDDPTIAVNNNVVHITSASSLNSSENRSRSNSTATTSHPTPIITGISSDSSLSDPENEMNKFDDKIVNMGHDIRKTPDIIDLTNSEIIPLIKESDSSVSIPSISLKSNSSNSNNNSLEKSNPANSISKNKLEIDDEESVTTTTSTVSQSELDSFLADKLVRMSTTELIASAEKLWKELEEIKKTFAKKQATLKEKQKISEETLEKNQIILQEKYRIIEITIEKAGKTEILEEVKKTIKEKQKTLEKKEKTFEALKKTMAENCKILDKKQENFLRKEHKNLEEKYEILEEKLKKLNEKLEDSDFALQKLNEEIEELTSDIERNVIKKVKYSEETIELVKEEKKSVTEKEKTLASVLRELDTKLVNSAVISDQPDCPNIHSQDKPTIPDISTSIPILETEQKKSFSTSSSIAFSTEQLSSMSMDQLSDAVKEIREEIEKLNRVFEERHEILEEELKISREKEKHLEEKEKTLAEKHKNLKEALEEKEKTIKGKQKILEEKHKNLKEAHENLEDVLKILNKKIGNSNINLKKLSQDIEELIDDIEKLADDIEHNEIDRMNYLEESERISAERKKISEEKQEMLKEKGKISEKRAKNLEEKENTLKEKENILEELLKQFNKKGEELRKRVKTVSEKARNLTNNQNKSQTANSNSKTSTASTTASKAKTATHTAPDSTTSSTIGFKNEEANLSPVMASEETSKDSFINAEEFFGEPNKNSKEKQKTSEERYKIPEETLEGLNKKSENLAVLSEPTSAGDAPQNKPETASNSKTPATSTTASQAETATSDSNTSLTSSSENEEAKSQPMMNAEELMRKLKEMEKTFEEKQRALEEKHKNLEDSVKEASKKPENSTILSEPISAGEISQDKSKLDSSNFENISTKSASTMPETKPTPHAVSSSTTKSTAKSENGQFKSPTTVISDEADSIKAPSENKSKINNNLQTDSSTAPAITSANPKAKPGGSKRKQKRTHSNNNFKNTNSNSPLEPKVKTVADSAFAPPSTPKANNYSTSSTKGMSRGSSSFAPRNRNVTPSSTTSG